MTHHSGRAAKPTRRQLIVGSTSYMYHKLHSYFFTRFTVTLIHSTLGPSFTTTDRHRDPTATGRRQSFFIATAALPSCTMHKRPKVRGVPSPTAALRPYILFCCHSSQFRVASSRRLDPRCKTPCTRRRRRRRLGGGDGTAPSSMPSTLVTVERSRPRGPVSTHPSARSSRGR